MKFHENKYRVNSFNDIEEILKIVNAKKGKEVVSTHYYVPQKGNGVIKLVQYKNRSEIHILEENHGKFSLKEKIRVINLTAGLKWLENQGFKTADVVKMANTDYEYKNGIVGLYLINDFLYSIILDYPDEQSHEMEKVFKLGKAEKITIPYNKYLSKLGKMKRMKLN